MDEAIEELRILLTDQIRILGQQHEDTSLTANVLAEPFGLDAINEHVAYRMSADQEPLSSRTTLELATAENPDFLMSLLMRDAVPADTVELILSLPQDDWVDHQANIALCFSNLTDQQWRDLAGRGFQWELGLREDAPEWYLQQFGATEV